MSSTMKQAELFMPVPWGQIRGKVWVLITVVLCCACTAWRTTVGRSTPSFPFYPKRGASQEMRQAMDESLRKRPKRSKKFTAERLLAANPTLSEQSVHILLERGLAQVKGGFVFSRDLRVHTTNILGLSLEHALEMQSNIQARVLVILGDKGYGGASTQPYQWKLISMLLQGFCDKNHTVITVSGDHYVHLNNPEVIAPFVFDFLQPKVLPEQQA